MAYTKIHAIKATVDKAIDYICNPEKTDEKMFVSSYACSPETAAYDFKYTLDHCRENSPNKAYHLIQAFAPGEVGFEEAHRIGKELADKLLEGKYSYVVTTHIDKGHVHNHIIFCAADNIEHNKYHDCKQSYYHIRKLSDELCKEHNLSVIIPGAQRGRKYKEWQSEQNGSAWKTQIRKEVAEMTNRNRANPVQLYLSDDEQYILNTKFKASGMKSMSAFLRKLILYGYVYDVDYSYLRNYNTELGRISSNLNQIAKRVNSTGNIYQEDINEVKELMNEV